MTQDVYCYMEWTGWPNETALVSLWERSWRAQGWITHILTSDPARDHPLHAKLMEKVASFPNVNDRRYVNANFRRWLAMAAIGGGVLSDHDIINYSFRPEHLEKAVGAPPDTAIVLDPLAPTPAYGSSKAFEKVVDFFLKYSRRPEDSYEGKPHICEMIICRNPELGLKRLPFAIEYTLENWNIKPMVHYGNWRWNNANPGVPRYAGIPSKRPLILA